MSETHVREIVLVVFFHLFVSILTIVPVNCPAIV